MSDSRPDPLRGHPARPPVRHPFAGDIGMLAVALIWGLNFSVTKGAFDRFPPLAFTGVRFAIASLFLLPLVRRLEGPQVLERGALLRLAALGVVGNTFYQLAFISGLARTTASNSALILASMPSIVALVAAAFGLETVRPRILFGVLVASVGVVVVILARGEGLRGGSLEGDLLSLTAVLCWAAYTLGLRLMPEGVSPLRVTAITTVAGAPGLVIAGFPEMLRMDWSGVGAPGWAALAYATVFSLVVAYILWNRSVQTVGASRTVVYMCLTPLIAVLGASVILGEHVRPLQMAGAILILGGVVLTRLVPRRGPECPPEG